MDVFLLILRIGLAGIFGLAGVAKFADLKGSKKAFKEFGVPDTVASPASIALSVGEIVIAGLFLAVRTSWYAAVGASILLILFLVQMVYQIARGKAPDCHCFGQIHSEPVGAKSIVRNVVFAILSGALVARGTNGQGAAIEQLPDAIMIELTFGVAVVGLLAAAIFYLKKISKQQTEVIRRIEVMDLVAREGGAVEREDVVHPHEGLPIGAMFPDFSLPDVAGTEVTLSGLMVQKVPSPMLFFFVAPTCGPCKTLVPEFEEWKAELDGKVRTIFISSGRSAENLAKFGADVSGAMLLQKGREVAEAAKAQWTPTAVLVDVNGRIASHTAAGDTAIRELVEKIKTESFEDEFTYITNGHNHANNSKLGRSIPEFKLTDHQGHEISDAYLKGKKTLVAFWSTGCQHCNAMIEDLRNWDGARGQDEPNLIVFSDGSLDEHEEFGLRSPVILDEAHKTSAGFGMYGTPSAVLVNEDGVIVSETAVGAPDIWALIGKRK